MIYQCSTPNIIALTLLVLKIFLIFNQFYPIGPLVGLSPSRRDQKSKYLAHLAKGQVSFCHRRRLLLAFHILIFSSENTEPI
jgi:hypothetical protein